jgi:hypothetical protein
VPLAVGEGIPPLEHEGAQVEAHQGCLAYPPWAFGRGTWQIGVPVVGAHVCKACVSLLIESYENPIRTSTPRASNMSHRALSECTIMNLGLHQTLPHAVDKGIEAYVTSRRARIPMFIDQHFSFRGALALHRKTFGRDVYKYPVNLMWGLPVALVAGTAALLAKAGAHRTAQWLHRIPRGMATALHQELQWLIYTELLELPYAQEGRASHRDALLEHILADPRIAALCDAYMMQLHGVAERPAFRAALARHLAEYAPPAAPSRHWPAACSIWRPGTPRCARPHLAPSPPARPLPRPSPSISPSPISGWVRPWVRGITRSFPSRPRRG